MNNATEGNMQLCALSATACVGAIAGEAVSTGHMTAARRTQILDRARDAIRSLAGTGGNADVMIMMVTGQTHENFMNSLNSLVDVFPAPAFTQVKRLAQSAVALAIEKMQIPAKAGAGLPVVP